MNRIPEWAGRYVSIPYEEKNCWQLLETIYATEFGITVGPVEVQRGHMRARDWVDVLDEGLGVREGDVILFRSSAVNKHVGVILNHELMIHSTKGCNSCIERWYSSTWKSRVVSIYRWTTECQKNN